MATTSNHSAIEARSEVRHLVKISGTYYLSIPPEFVKVHSLEAGEGLLMRIGSVLTIAPIPKGEVLIPEEEILLPYPEDLSTGDEGQLSVAAFAKNYQRIHEYVKQERPHWDHLEVTMDTIEIDKQRFFKVTQIISKTPAAEE